MSETLTIIAAIFGLMGLGYASVLTGVLAGPVGQALSDFVFTIAIPILLFLTLASADFDGLSAWRIWGAYFIPFGLIWAAAHLIIRRVFARDAQAGAVAGASAAFSNSVLIGIPLMQAAFGEAGTIYLIVIVSVHLPVMMLLGVVLNEFAENSMGDGEKRTGSRAETWGRLLLTLATHPILLSIVAGALWRLAGLPIPGLASAILDPIARTAGPLALFAAGMGLRDFGVARQIRPAIAISALKLLALPVLVFATARLFGLPPLGVAVLTLTAACPTGVNAYLLATRLGTGEALASNAMLISTGAGVITVTLWLAFLQA